MRKVSLTLALVLTTASAAAFAQTRPVPPPPSSTPRVGAQTVGVQPVVASPVGAPQGPASGSPSANPVALPPPPDVADPMLAPVPTPKRVLGSWREAVSLLRTRSTDLRVAMDEVLQAEAETRIALARYLPTLSGSGVFSHQLITNPGGITVSSAGLVASSRTPTPNVYGGSIALSQAIINVQDFDQISINELGEDAARMTVDDEKRTLALSVANQIVAVVTAEREAEINRGGLRVALEQAAITDRKLALGAANGLDVVRAKQNAANARAALVTGDESLREAREALGLALGLPEETGVSPDVDVSGLAQDAANSCRVVANVDDRSDIAAARTKLEVAKRSLTNVWYTFLPTVSAQSTLSATSTSGPGYPNPTWNIQGVLQVPIWDGGARYGGLKNARAAQDIALQQLEALRRQAVVQVEQARRQLIVAEQSAVVSRDQRDLANQNDKMTQLAYQTGQGTSLELVTASEAHRQAEINLALAEFNVVKARLLAMLALATCPW